MTEHQLGFLDLGYLLTETDNEVTLTPSDMFQWENGTPARFVITHDDSGTLLTRVFSEDLSVGELFAEQSISEVLDDLFDQLDQADKMLYQRLLG